MGTENHFNPMLCVTLDGLVPSDIIIPFGRITSDVVVTKRAFTATHGYFINPPHIP